MNAMRSTFGFAALPAVAVLVLSGAVAMAGGTGGAAAATQASPTATHRIGELHAVRLALASLNLSGQVKPQTDKMVSDYVAAHKAWYQQNKTQITQLRTQIKAAREGMETATVKTDSAQLKQLTETAPALKDTINLIRGVLTADQLTQFDAKLAELTPGHAAHGHAKAAAMVTPATPASPAVAPTVTH